MSARSCGRQAPTGGTQPLWARNGRELFYLAPDGALMAVPVAPRGHGWGAGVPARLIEGRYVVKAGNNFGRQYDVSPNGQRFLIIKEGGDDASAALPQIIVVQNWLEELERLVPTN